MNLLILLQETIVANPAVTTTDYTSIIGLLFGGSSIVYLIVKELMIQRQKRMESDLERKTLQVKSAIENDKYEKTQDSQLEKDKFELDKIKQLKMQADNETFQKEIINEIFGKYVKQNDWITTLYEKKFEEVLNTLSETKKELKDLRILSDKMNLQIKNVDDRVIKNTNITIAKVDTLIKLFSGIPFTCVKNKVENKESNITNA